MSLMLIVDFSIVIKTRSLSASSIHKVLCHYFKFEMANILCVAVGDVEPNRSCGMRWNQPFLY